MTVQRRQRGFTITEILVTVGMVAIIAGIAVPSYTSYIVRSRLPASLNALTSFATRLEQFYQDNANYGVGTCGTGMTAPAAEKFTITCALSNGGQGFTATATGESGGQTSGYTFTIDHQGNRRTTAHPKATTLPMNCWTLKGSSCDA